MDPKAPASELRTLSDWISRFKKNGEAGLPSLEVPVLVVGVTPGESFEVQTSAGPKNPPPTPVAPELHVVIPLARRKAATSNTFTVGRAPICDIVVPFGPVSKVHASLKVEGGRWSLCDVGSTNGTRVGGRPLERNAWELLTDGETINFGVLTMRFWMPKTFVQKVLPSLP